MRSSSLLLIGATAALSLFLLSMQGESLAASDVTASKSGIQIASILSMDYEYAEAAGKRTRLEGEPLRWVVYHTEEENNEERPEPREEEHDHTHNDEEIIEEAERDQREEENPQQEPEPIPEPEPTPEPEPEPIPEPEPEPEPLPEPEPEPAEILLPAIAAAEASEHHKAMANEVLMALPAQCRDTLQNFYVKYEKQRHRGLAGKRVMILDGTRPDEEFRALFVHESGHNFDLGCLTGDSSSEKSAFADGGETIYMNDPSVDFYSISWITSDVQRSDAKAEDFASGYASYNVFEDFAEGFAYFVLHNSEFKKRAETNDAMAQKYAWFRDVLFNGRIPSIATSRASFTGKVPWDITKLEYDWHPSNLVVLR